MCPLGYRVGLLTNLRGNNHGNYTWAIIVLVMASNQHRYSQRLPITVSCTGSNRPLFKNTQLWEGLERLRNSCTEDTHILRWTGQLVKVSISGIVTCLAIPGYSEEGSVPPQTANVQKRCTINQSNYLLMKCKQGCDMLPTHPQTTGAKSCSMQGGSSLLLYDLDTSHISLCSLHS